MSENSPLRTVIVEGPLAFAMRRFEAARAGEIGLEILSFPQLAARLAGGFLQPINPEILEPAIQVALTERGFKEIESVSDLPGMTRAVAQTLQKVWNADIDLEAAATEGAPRLGIWPQSKAGCAPGFRPRRYYLATYAPRQLHEFTVRRS